MDENWPLAEFKIEQQCFIVEVKMAEGEEWSGIDQVLCHPLEIEEA